MEKVHFLLKNILTVLPNLEYLQASAAMLQIVFDATSDQANRKVSI